MQRVPWLASAALFGVILLVGQLPIASAAGSISGKYRNTTGGYEITFPKGWSGIEFAGVWPFVSPDGFDLFKGFPKVYMMTAHFNMTAASQLQNMATPNPASKINCQEISNRYILLNKVRSWEIVEECNTNGEFAKVKRYYVANNDFVISSSFSANSTAAFNKNVNAFEQSIQTLRVDKQTDIKSYFQKVAGTKTIVQKIDNKTIKLETTSTLSGFKFDKARKTLTFTAEGKKGTPGLTEISIGQVLNGPYKVTIDGKNVKDVRVIEDTTTRETLVGFNYDHNKKHTIVISTVAITGPKAA